MMPIRHPFETAPAEGAAIEVAPDILWIRLPLPMALDHVNVYALRDGDGWCIIDTGYHSKRGIALWETLLAGPLRGDPVTRVLLTHHHPDHVGNVGWFQTVQGADLWTTRTAWFYARMMTIDVQETWPKESLEFYLSAGMDKSIYDDRRAKRPFNFGDVVFPLPLGFQRIKDGDTLRIGDRDWLILTGDGHAPEQATLWCEADNLVISGDQILPRISPNVSVYPTEPMADPLAEWLTSCQKFRKLAHEDHFVLPGHKLPFTGLPTRMRQLEENHHSALERLVNALKTPRTAVGCFDILFKRTIGAPEYGLAMGEAIAHLNHLMFAGKVVREMNDQGAWLWRKK